jgi:hypothetical protein
MKKLSSLLKMTSLVASRRWQTSVPTQDELKRSDSGDGSTDGNTSKTTIESTKLVDILDIENEVEIQDHHVSAMEPVASVVFEEEMEDYEDMHGIGKDETSKPKEDDQIMNPDSSAPIVDRTPSKVIAIAQDQPKGADRAELVEESDQTAHPASAPALEPDPAPSPSPSKPKYTKEEKQRRFLRELFRITSRHIKDKAVNDDDDSIVSSAVGSVSSLPPPTPLEQFLHWFSCTANFQSGAIMDVENPCPCNRDHNNASSHSPNIAVQAPVEKDGEDAPIKKGDDDSLDQALAGMPPQSPSDLNCPLESPTLTLQIPSPITVWEDASTSPDEIIEGDENSGAVTVKYSVRHVASVVDENHPQSYN